jgi:N-dimethylarginine dimethylaminohydrolase
MTYFDTPAGTLIEPDELKHRLERPDLLMVSGLEAGVQATENENWFTQQFLKTRSSDSKHVIMMPEMDEDVQELVQAYRKNGHTVHVMTATPGHIDGHYSTDSNKTFQAACYDKTSGHWRLERPLTIFPNFTHHHRQPEVLPKKAFFEQTHHILYQMEHPMEFGDTRIILRNPGNHFVLAGLAEDRKVKSDDTIVTIGRSTQEGHHEFETILQAHVDKSMKVYTIHLRQPFYHMDTTGIPCTNGEFFTTRSAYTDESWGLLQDLFGEKLIELPIQDIRDAFGGNGTCFGDQIYISDMVSPRTISLLEDYGYIVNQTSIRHTICSGGGQRCMTSVCYTVPVE